MGTWQLFQGFLLDQVDAALHDQCLLLLKGLIDHCGRRIHFPDDEVRNQENVGFLLIDGVIKAARIVVARRIVVAGVLAAADATSGLGGGLVSRGESFLLNFNLRLEFIGGERGQLVRLIQGWEHVQEHSLLSHLQEFKVDVVTLDGGVGDGVQGARLGLLDWCCEAAAELDEEVLELVD